MSELLVSGRVVSCWIWVMFGGVLYTWKANTAWGDFSALQGRDLTAHGGEGFAY